MQDPLDRVALRGALDSATSKRRTERSREPRAARFLAWSLLACALQCTWPRAAAVQSGPTVGQAAGSVTSTGSAQRLDVAPYATLDDTYRSVTHFNPEPVRPMAATPDGTTLYAVNVHASFVAVYTTTTGQPSDRLSTPLAPVAVALWNGRLLVVCAGSNALVHLDPITHETLALVNLPSEPADIVVDAPRGRAFVACAGVDGVAEIDLASFAVTRVHGLPSKRPRRLALEPDGTVLVAPTLSGNNSTVVGAPGNAAIIDLANPAIAPTGGLPDHDLFRIDPDANTVEPVLRGMGSLLFGHGRNPSTGQYWVLNVDSLNKDPAKQNLAALRGSFARNALSIASTPAVGVAEPTAILDLDDIDGSTPGGQYDAAQSLALPTGLEFSTTGLALVTSPASDRVSFLDTLGARFLDFDLPAGSLPLATQLYPLNETLLFVYCFGTNEIPVYSLSPLDTVTPAFVLDLGFDPTPAPEKAGRAIFYDADRSADGRFTCGHCHPGGLADGLAWNLSDLPEDPKGPLVTQSLFGLEALFPYHWRGENGFAAFNETFPRLLGAAAPLDTTPGGELDQLAAFVFGLHTPANPYESLRRRLESSANTAPQANGAVGNAVRGQQVFRQVASDGALTCAACHSLPTGTSGDVIAETLSPHPRRTNFDVSPFSNGQLLRKDQPVFSVTTSTTVLDVPALGFGLLHPGTVDTLFDFNESTFPQLAPQQVADVTEYLRVFDHGISPAAQRALLLDEEHLLATRAELESILLPQARLDWIGVTLFGTYPVDDVPTPLRWVYVPEQNRFWPNDSTVSPIRPRDLWEATASGLARNVVVTVPPMNELRFGLDADDDGLIDADELTHGTDPWNPDSDGDLWPDGYELVNAGDPTQALTIPFDTKFPGFAFGPQLLWNNSTVAKLALRADEPVTVTVEYQTSFGAARQERSTTPSRVHTLVLQDLLQSTPSFLQFGYTGFVRIHDLQGNASQLPLPTFTTDPMIFDPGLPLVAVVGNAQWAGLTPSQGNGTLAAEARLRVDYKAGGPPAFAAANRVVVCGLSVNGNAWSNFTSPLPTTGFSINGSPFNAQPGPFVMSTLSTVTGANDDGEVTLNFTAAGLAPGDIARLYVVGVFEANPQTYDPFAPDFTPAAQLFWSLADTRREFRALQTTY